jgi:CspA family cold shock protein
MQHLCHHPAQPSCAGPVFVTVEEIRRTVCWNAEERQHMSTQGTVKWFNSEKGFGFIAPDDGGADVFAHYTAIEASGYRSLEENQRVEFDVAQGPKGLQAENIRPL